MLAEELYKNLIDDGILDTKGYIRFELLNIKTTAKTKSVIGDIIQDWLANYLKSKNIKFENPKHTQAFPDFYLIANENKEMLEIKCFNSKASPAFDVANFKSYCLSLLETPERLDSYYMIFSYLMHDDFSVSIENLWLKRVWEITRPMEDWPVNLQIKEGQIYTIRPATWYSKRSSFKTFESRLKFIEALNICLKRYTPTNHLYKDSWLDKIKSGYKARTGQELN